MTLIKNYQLYKKGTPVKLNNGEFAGECGFINKIKKDGLIVVNWSGNSKDHEIIPKTVTIKEINKIISTREFPSE